MTIDMSEGGKVGIGTDAPPHKFSVFGTGVGNATVQIEGEGGADPYINFLANNTQHWSAGIDDSDSDKFKISKHSALGTNDYLNIDTSGNVSIGTTSAYDGLNVYKSSNTAFRLHNSTTGVSTSAGFVIQQAGDESYVWNYEPSSLIFGTDNTSQVIINRFGSLSIKASSPIHYTGYAALDFGLTGTMYSATSGTNITSLINNAYLNSNASAWVYKQADEASYLAMMDGKFRFFTAAAGSAGGSITWGDEKMVIEQGGNVGIGTSSPAAQLEINALSSGHASTSNIFRITAPTYPMMEFYSTNTNTNNRNWKIASVYNAYGTLEFLRSSAANGTPNQTTLAMNAVGNVGLGTHVPSCALEVVNAGEARIKARSTNNNWAGLDLEAHSAQSNYIFFRDNSAERARIQVTDNDEFIILQGNSPGQRFEINSEGRAEFYKYSLKFNGNTQGKHEIRTGGRTGTGTFTLFTNGVSNTQSAGIVEVWGIYGTPSGASYRMYVISGNRLSLIHISEPTRPY